MDLETTVLLSLVGVLALNQGVMRIGSLYRIGPLFFGLVLLDLVVGTAVLWFGLPGFEAFPPVSWVVGLLFFVHAAQDLGIRQRRLDEDRAKVEAERAGAYAALARRLDDPAPAAGEE